MARLKELYKNQVAPALMQKFGYKSVMQIPKLDKIVINIHCIFKLLYEFTFLVPGGYFNTYVIFRERHDYCF